MLEDEILLQKGHLFPIWKAQPKQHPKCLHPLYMTRALFWKQILQQMDVSLHNTSCALTVFETTVDFTPLFKCLLKIGDDTAYKFQNKSALHSKKYSTFKTQTSVESDLKMEAVFQPSLSNDVIYFKKTSLEKLSSHLHFIVQIYTLSSITSSHNFNKQHMGFQLQQNGLKIEL